MVAYRLYIGQTVARHNLGFKGGRGRGRRWGGEGEVRTVNLKAHFEAGMWTVNLKSH